MFSARVFGRALILAIPLLTAGCVPGVAWLPDSSGFVFTGGKDGKQLLHLDVASRKTNVILDDTKANAVWPALSPDGKTIALAQLTGKDREATKLHIRLVDREGKELLKSAEVVVRERGDEINVRGLPQLFWRPTGDKILVSADMTTLIFDVKAGTFKKSEAMPVIFGHTPVAPDGKHFVVSRHKGGDDVPYALMDWDGNLHDIKPDKGVAALLTELEKVEPKETEEQRGLAMLTPTSFGGHWDGHVAKVSWAGLHLEIDAKNKTMSGALRKPSTFDGKQVQTECYVEAKLLLVQFLRLERLAEKDLADLFIYRVRIDAQETRDDKPMSRRMVIPKADRVVAIPSPDGRLLALRCAVPVKDMGKLTHDDYRDRIVVINSRGFIVAEWEGPLSRAVLR